MKIAPFLRSFFASVPQQQPAPAPAPKARPAVRFDDDAFEAAPRRAAPVVLDGWAARSSAQAATADEGGWDEGGDSVDESAAYDEAAVDETSERSADDSAAYDEGAVDEPSELSADDSAAYDEAAVDDAGEVSADDSAAYDEPGYDASTYDDSTYEAAPVDDARDSDDARSDVDASAPLADEPETTTVRRGESLSAVAARVYSDANRWPELYEANRDVLGDNPNFVRAGVELTLPDSDFRLSREERNQLLADAYIPPPSLSTEPEPAPASEWESQSPYGVDAAPGELSGSRWLNVPQPPPGALTPDWLTDLQRIDAGDLTVDPKTRLGAYAATAGYRDGTVGAAVHNAIGTIYGTLGTVGEEEIGTVFNSPQARALYNKPVDSDASRQMAELEYAYWSRISDQKPDSTGGKLGSMFSPAFRDFLQQQLFSRF
jgi:nucleoid-associated protein YgaU